MARRERGPPGADIPLQEVEQELSQASSRAVYEVEKIVTSEKGRQNVTMVLSKKHLFWADDKCVVNSREIDVGDVRLDEAPPIEKQVGGKRKSGQVRVPQGYKPMIRPKRTAQDLELAKKAQKRKAD